ncbi:MAG TPA: hypothetical protein VLR89_03630 [Anaerolineaceae bacterium]|nr:hypothetical protein [Anaerolineaceae bacterium]
MDTLLLARDYPVEIEVALPCKGKVLVRTGQSVKAGDPIAEASFPDHYQFFDLVHEFGIKPEEVSSVLQRQEGDPLSQGDVVALKKGFVSRYFWASENGALILARDGRLTLAYGEKKLIARAPYDGIISQIMTGKGAMLANQSMVVQGQLLFGKRSSGPFVRLEPEELAKQPRKLDKDLKGTVLWLDGPLTAKIWDRIKGLELAALVLASTIPGLPPMTDKLPFSLMLMMGAGDATLDELSRALLMDMLGMIVILEPNARSGHTDRPVLFRVWDPESHPLVAKPLPQLQVGSQVRLLGKPYQGLLAKVEEISAKPENFASGVCRRAALLRVDEDTLVRLPINNLELILS